MQRRGELHRMMVVELSQGEEYAKRLQRILLDPALPPLSSVRSSSEEEASLINKVLSSFDIVLSLLKSSAYAPPVTDSSLSVGIRPSSRTYHKNSGIPLVENRRQKVSKKRKALPKWTAQVNLSREAGTEELMEDGYVWRKYGQKEILGSAHPREYYRCRHKYDHGCEATKHAQRSDENPSVFNITYRGKHTCNELIHLSPTATTMTMALCNSPENQHSFDLPHNFGPELQQYCSLDPPMSSVSPPFFSPATTSDSNYYIFSGGIEQPNLNNSESDFTEIISAMTSAPNSPLPDFECLETLCLDHDLLFDEKLF